MQALINKETLATVGATKEVSAAFIAERTKLSLKKVKCWLNTQDTTLPTFNQAKVIAKCLHIPFAALYMNALDLPLEQIRKYKIKNFRLLPNGGATDDSSVNIAISDLLQARSFLIKTKSELGEDINLFRPDFAPHNDATTYWAAAMRTVFKINLQEQFATASARKFYLYVREAIEAQGIFVHCFTDVSVDTVRGIAIYDSDMPIIGINDADRYPAKTFSMIHELVHILKRQSSMCNEMFSSFSHHKEEVFCNAVAGECLVPAEALSTILRNRRIENFTMDDIASLAQVFSVSKEVIVRRLLDSEKISQTAYEVYVYEIQRLFATERDAQREAAKIALAEGRQAGFQKRQEYVAIDKTSSSLCRTLYNGYYDKFFSKQDVARYLGMNQKHVDKFLKEVALWR